MISKSRQFCQDNLQYGHEWLTDEPEEMTQRRRAKTATSSLQQIDTHQKRHCLDIAPFTLIRLCLPAAVLPNSTECQARACQRPHENEILRSQASTRQSGMSYNTDLAAAYAFVFSRSLLPTQPS